MINFKILTIFPELFPGPLAASITGAALQKKLWQIEAINIRDFAKDERGTVDDTPYGGGAGMVLKADVIFDAIEVILTSFEKGFERKKTCLTHVFSEKAHQPLADRITIQPDVEDLIKSPRLVNAAHFDPPSFAKRAENKPKIIYLSPRGKTFTQKKAQELAKEEQIILLCGRYEGVDQRVLDEFEIEEISIGDYVLSGGEIAAYVLIDAILRNVPNVLGADESLSEESFSGEFENLLEYPHYTKPQVWRGRKVPEVLTQGHHKKINEWRKEQAIAITKKNRPDLMARFSISN